MLYHVPDRSRVLAEIRRALRPGGHLFAATNGQTHLRELHTLIERFDPGAALWGGGIAADDFGLENGPEQLARHFSSISVERYENTLVVPDAQPLVAYILSASPALDTETVERLAKFVEEEIGRHGAIRITVVPGRLVATP
jgi:SAM-dependent methyltransferase